MFRRAEVDPQPSDSIHGTGIARRHAGLIPVAEYMRMSTDHQKYSIEFQCAAIRRFAVQHGMSVIRTYLDDGRSGLHLKGRPGLQSLLRDVIGSAVDYAAVLVYDVSRWGRFQNADESAYYEFMCKQAGVRVIYCSEPFDDTPMGGLFKNIKRVMAAEYSRNLSDRVWGGQAHSVVAGFKQGGQPGYGFRRFLLSYDRKPKGILRSGEYKMLTSDRVILVPGPRDEVETVWWIYDSFILDGKSAQQIADELNARSPDSISRWSRADIRGVLSHPKYTGVNIFNRRSRKLRSKTVNNPESLWIRRDLAFTALISREYFELAANLIKTNKGRQRWSTDSMKAQLRRLLRREGYLSSALIQKEPDMADTQTYVNRFGSVQAAFESVGYCSLRSRPVRSWNRQRSERQARLVEEILELLRAASIKAQWDARARILWVSSGRTIAVAISAFRCYCYKSRQYWHIERLHRMKFDECLMVRLNEGNSAAHDYHVLPYSALQEMPRNVVTLGTRSIAPYKLAGLDLLASRWRVDLQSAAAEGQ